MAVDALAFLRREAAQIGVPVDNRWRHKRLLEEITRAKSLQQVGTHHGWTSMLVNEPFAGAWQQNQEIKVSTALSHWAVYACTTRIARDIAKLGVDLVKKDEDTGIYRAVENSAYSPVLERPNKYQTRIQFFEAWVVSLLAHGNAYVLKEWDNRMGLGNVREMHILDPTRVKPLVSDEGEVFYELRRDNLAGLEDEQIIVPARDIIHDRMTPLFHPLVGVSPITAASLATLQGMAIQKSSATFFANGSQPGGVILVPGKIDQEQVERLRQKWNDNHSGLKAGGVAFLSDGMTYKPIAMSATDAQLIEQLRWSAEMICSVFHMPPHIVGVTPPPAQHNIEAIAKQYFAGCLQGIIHGIQTGLREGLRLRSEYRVRFKLTDLILMDTPAKAKYVTELSRDGVMAPNEARGEFNLPPIEGGDTVFMQHQMWPVQLLADRVMPANPSVPLPDPNAAPDEPTDGERMAVALTRKFMRACHAA